MVTGIWSGIIVWIESVPTIYILKFSLNNLAFYVHVLIMLFLVTKCNDSLKFILFIIIWQFNACQESFKKKGVRVANQPSKVDCQWCIRSVSHYCGVGPLHPITSPKNNLNGFTWITEMTWTSFKIRKSVIIQEDLHPCACDW